MNKSRTLNNWTLLISRTALAITIFPHGAQKVLGMWGGYGFSGTLNAFTERMHIPAPLAILAFAAEFLGAIGILAGLFTHLSAVSIAATMAVAMAMNSSNGFFMNWFGAQKGEGIEYFLPILGLCAILIANGAGEFSLDSVVRKLRFGRTATAIAA